LPIEPIAAGSGSSLYAAAATRAPKQTMDGELFMQLLVTQLQNQDPSAPMDTNAMISQTTQLSMMEKLNTMAGTGTDSFNLQMRAAAASLLDSQVSYTGADGTTVTGKASSVSYSPGKAPQVTVGNTTVALDQLTSVTSS
jgi:flagellar basal-body rod modification protein FlgD